MCARCGASLYEGCRWVKGRGETLSEEAVCDKCFKEAELQPISRVKTSFVNPPIPIRAFDWIAWIDGEEESMRYGYGRTEQEAKDELANELAQYDESEPAAQPEASTDDVVRRMLQAWTEAKGWDFIGTDNDCLHCMTAALAVAREGCYSLSEIEKAIRAFQRANPHTDQFVTAVLQRLTAKPAANTSRSRGEHLTQEWRGQAGNRSRDCGGTGEGGSQVILKRYDRPDDGGEMMVASTDGEWIGNYVF